jgi:hypothetical protein
MRPQNLEDESISLRELLMQKVLVAWRDPTCPCVEFRQKEYVTAGSAVASRNRFRIIGRWGMRPRSLDVHGVGLKRSIGLERAMKLKGAKGVAELMKSFVSTQEREADRCHSLVDTVPAEPPADAFNQPSKAYKPKWLDEDFGFTLDNDWASEADLETEEVMLGL